MLRSRASATDEEGSTSLEFIVAGLVLLVPIVYVILAVSSIQGAALGVEGAARQAARVYVEADSDAAARADASAAVEVALADFGVAAEDATVAITCSPEPRECLTRNGFVTVTISARATLPLVPSVLDLDEPLSVPLSSSATVRVSRFGGATP